MQFVLYFSHNWTQATGLRKEDHRGKVSFPSGYMKCTCYQYKLSLFMFNLTIWVRFLHGRVMPFLPFPYCILWQEVTTCNLHLSKGMCSTILRAKYLHKLFVILLHNWCHFSLIYVVNLINVCIIFLWTILHNKYILICKYFAMIIL